jgi:hypothetical protein
MLHYTRLERFARNKYYFIGPIHNIRKNEVLLLQPSAAIFTKLQYLCNLQLGPIGHSVSLHKAGKEQTHYLTGPICKIQRK